MPLSLSSSWEKFKRGREHVELVEECVDEWLGTNAYTISREVDPQSGYTVRRAQIKESPPPRISVLVGDAVQNLRSSLDHAVYALAESRLTTIPPEREELLMFPIVGNVNRSGQAADGAKTFASITRGNRDYLFGIVDPAREFIEREQPYHWGDTPDAFRFHWLWSLHDLNRIDKHRRMALTTAFLGLQFVTTPASVEPRVTCHRAEVQVKDGDPLVTYSGADVGVHAEFTRGVAINEGVMAGWSV